MKYPDIKTIVDHIYHNYMTRCEIVLIQNKIVALDKEIVPWFDETLFYDVATDMKIAFEKEDFVNITEPEQKPLMKQYDC